MTTAIRIPCEADQHNTTVIRTRPWRRFWRKTRVLVCWKCDEVWVMEPWWTR